MGDLLTTVGLLRRSRCTGRGIVLPRLQRMPVWRMGASGRLDGHTPQDAAAGVSVCGSGQKEPRGEAGWIAGIRAGGWRPQFTLYQGWRSLGISDERRVGKRCVGT